MVLVGVNVDHTQLVELAEEHFVNPETSWRDVASTEVDGSISQYTGGIIEVSFYCMIVHVHVVIAWN